MTRPAPPQQIRIIGGQWKRRLLPIPSLPGLRPTPDRVRETLANWMAHQCQQNWPSLVVLDLFAGTGALGLEFASRGAGQVVLNETQPQAIKQLQQTLQKLNAAHVQLRPQDALQTLAQAHASYNLILLDPPYEQGWLARVWPHLAAALMPGGWVYVECEAPLPNLLPPPALEPFQTLRSDKAGQVHYHLLQFQPELSR
ncbi:16S rRNA (guanine(966)-N(2))-methyltransferase RsmD [Parvibium lacunae]|uniref:16S rRNA (Guanine(966)-N(2))-methyltransferase RsmD n=1 Tax=Parvibium lacunae TaxID=1888893 RepID=A0A368L097_9BURK|nr:16S rRNA (guanine(966)-N(2))-methyltransferase RsmD [Parvibium lacunae]RCS56983.1 16S rRNA (guanine(966)-N(2))-methyltransferase RsmD [Parvibium lacunae]